MAPININGNNYSFIHKSILEYFASEYVYNTFMKYSSLYDFKLIKIFVKLI